LVSYQLIGGSLYSVHPILLQIVTQPVGYLVLGFPVNDVVATQIGDAIRAEVCFLAGGSCVAATEHAHSEAMTREIRSVQPGGQRHRTIAGHKYAVVSERLADNAGAIVFALRLDDVLAPFVHIQSALRIVGLVALLAGVVLAVFIARGLARPVRTLVSATERVARGDYSTHVEIRNRDELGKLCTAFNDMTDGLQLRDHYRGLLDKVVSRDIADELLKGEIVLGGENREVTVLFADIRRFTPLTRGMEPQRIIGLLNEVMDGLSAAVEAEEGVVDKYVGDQLMALFGAPIARPDDPQRAVRAALKMQAAMEQWSAARGATPIARVGIGINTGMVVAGNMGSQRRLNYTVLGEPVNLAARLCAAAEPGQILVSAATYTLITQAFATADLGARYLKGFSTPVPVFEVLDYELPLVNATT
jgi:adenylate cyclase